MIDLKSRWDDETGLFFNHPDKRGHTADCFGRKDLHSIPDSVSFMTYAAQLGRLGEIDCLRVLENTRKCQYIEGEKRGVIKWYLEDGDHSDGNAPFFICVGLVPLRKYFAEELGDECCRILDEILGDALHCFLAKSDRRSVYYPNSYLGDLVFSWLINETHGETDRDAELAEILETSARYWIDEGWGWGEHMSDGYAKVCCYELSMLLLMSERLPENVRNTYLEALTKLLEIEDVYAGKPRVPAIRSYSFEDTPKAKRFRNQIRDWTPDDDLPISNMPPIGQLLNHLGWHDVAPPAKEPLGDIRVPCFNETEARAFVLNDFRIGAVSRYPVMEHCDFWLSGLSWQSFPVAFLHDDGDWGFLQWLTVEDGATYAHPCHKKDFDREKGLSAKVAPAIAGETFSMVEGRSVLVLRRMPMISKAWTTLTDRLRVVSPTMEFEEKRLADHCSRITFKWGERTLSVARVTFSDAPVHDPVQRDGNKLDWAITYAESVIPMLNDAVTLWAFAVDDEIKDPPAINPVAMRRRPTEDENQVFDLDWNVGLVHWRLRVNPISNQPFMRL